MLKKNEIIDLEIVSITNECSGLGRYGEENFVVFVPQTAIGDKIKARILKVTKHYAYGKIEEMITPSKDRCNNTCNSFTRCGGCGFRHVTYAAELQYKRTFVDDAFNKMAKLGIEIPPVLGLDATEKYRNKAQFPLSKDNKGKAFYGFFAPHSHHVIDCKGCALHPDIFTEIADKVLQLSEEYGISIYDESTHTGVLRHICIRQGHYSKEIQVCLVVRRKVPEIPFLATSLCEHFSLIKSVVLNINKDKTNVILGELEILLQGTETITDTICGNNIQISAKSFYQVNTPAAEKMYGMVSDFANAAGKTVLDLYCGIGTIGLSLAKTAKQIIGIEIVPAATQNATQNALLNGIENATFYNIDAANLAEKVNPAAIDIVILDPPRKGCDEKTVQAIIAVAPKTIIMMSCNPTTAARDCIKFKEAGYKIEKLQAVDMFPRTGHVECVLSMTSSAENALNRAF